MSFFYDLDCDSQTRDCFCQAEFEEFICTIFVSQSNASSSLQTVNDITKVFRADQFEKISKLILINDRSVFLFSFPFTLDVQIYFPCVQAHNKMA